MTQRLSVSPGDRYGRLVIHRELEKNLPISGRCRERMFECICDCGKVTIVQLNNLRKGSVKSCGCYRSEVLKTGSITHGQFGTRLYACWRDMLCRCRNPHYKAFHDYGGRGIKVCAGWLQFQAFHDWAMTNGYRDDLTIDRKDVDGNYEPGNCRWITRKDQGLNKRNTSYVTFNGQERPLKEWCRIMGLEYSVVYYRIHRYGWSVDKALTTPNANSNAEEFKRKVQEATGIVTQVA